MNSRVLNAINRVSLDQITGVRHNLQIWREDIFTVEKDSGSPKEAKT